MNDEVIDLIVLLNGNFLPIATLTSKKNTMQNSLVAAYKAGQKDPNHFINFGDSVIISKNIVGWYFRPHGGTVTEQVLELLKKQTSDGDDWKS